MGSVYEVNKKSVENARRDYELYRDLDRVRRMVKAYYDIIAKFGVLQYLWRCKRE